MDRERIKREIIQQMRNSSVRVHRSVILILNHYENHDSHMLPSPFFLIRSDIIKLAML